MKEKSAKPHWTDKHITKETYYIAWDETGAQKLGSFSTKALAKQELIRYAETLNRIFKGEKSENHKSKP